MYTRTLHQVYQNMYLFEFFMIRFFCLVLFITIRNAYNIQNDDVNRKNINNKKAFKSKNQLICSVWCLIKINLYVV